VLGVSERRACRVLGQARAVQRYTPIVRDDEDPLTQRVIELACVYGRYGTPRITAMLRREGWRVNHKRVERIWRQQGLKVPQRQPKRGRLWLNDGSCIRLRPQHKDHVWAYDFLSGRTHDGRPFRMLTLVDEFTRECLSIDVARQLRSDDVLERLSVADGDARRAGAHPERQRPGVHREGRAGMAEAVGVKTLFIEPGSPWENGYVESFNGKLRDELLDREIFYTLAGGEGADRALAGRIQHGAAAQLAGVPASGTGGGDGGDRCRGPLRCAPGPSASERSES
jgi:putative transposase